MIQFFAPEIETTLQLPESDSRHAVRVLRLQPGATIEVIDGKGHRFTCVLVDGHSKHASVEIVERCGMPLPWPQEIVAAVAPTKHIDRMEWMVEKLTEIGVNRIIPVLCQRSERKELRRDRLEKIAVSAMKQSLKATLPVVEEMTPLSNVITRFDRMQRFVGYCDDQTPRVDLACAYRPMQSAAILIGPEGDFTPAEIAETLRLGWQPVILGPCRLRTETAAVSAVDTLHILDRHSACLK